MKNLTKIFMAVAVAMLAFACVTDTTEDLGLQVGNGENGLTVELSLSLEESRTQLGEKVDGIYPLYWSEGDKISVNGVASGEAVINESNPASAVFAVQEAESYAVAYPAASEGQVLFAEKQNHVAEGDTFASGVSTMYGYGTDRNAIQLNHLTGVLKVGIKGEATLAKAQISTIDRAPIAGAFDIDFATGELEATTASKDVIEYSFGEAGLQLSSEAQYIYVAVPAGQYDELYITLYEKGNSGNIMYATVKAGDSKPLTAGNVREFKSAITYAPNAQLYVINSVERLQAFKAAVESAEGLAIDALLTEDIDMTDVAWTPIAGESYVNTLIGNGYAIKGLTAPLFATTSASFKGVHLEDVNITTNDRNMAGALACKVTATDTATPKIENCSVSGTFTVKNDNLAATASVRYGALLGYVCGAEINGCQNYATVTAEVLYTSGKAVHLAGVVGSMDIFTKSDATVLYSKIYNSTNHGAVTSGAACSNTSYIGGVVGCSVDNNIGVEISSCTNNGAVSLTSTTAGLNIGGVCGYAISNGELGLVSEVKNYGGVTIKSGASATGESNVGGLFGSCRSLPLSDSYNKGTVHAEEGAKMAGVNMGSIFGLNTYINGNKKGPTTNTTNDGEVKFGASNNSATSANTTRIGGIVGYGQSRLTNIVNNGKITIYGTRNANGTISQASNAFRSGSYVIAGIAGYKTEGAIDNCSNHGDIEIAGTLKELHATNKTEWKIAGICSYLSTNLVGSCVCDGEIIVSGTIEGEANIGGKIAFTYADQDSETSNTNITIKKGAVLSGGAIIGGVICWTSMITKNHCTYKGTITIEEGVTIGTKCYIGGCVGMFLGITSSTKTAENMNNHGAILNNGTLTNGGFIGGTLGYAKAAADASYTDDKGNTTTYKNCKAHAIKNATNNGTVSCGPKSVTTGTNLYVGGIAGHVAAVTTATNSGKITIDGSHTGGNNYFSGCIADGTGNATGLTNNADIECPATASFKVARIGGVMGYSSSNVSGTNLGCINYAATSTGIISIGGIAYRGIVIDCVNGVDGDATKGVINYTGASGSSATSASLNVGGIVVDPKGNCSNSTNYAPINVGGSMSHTLYGGGICYSAVNEGTTMTDCANYGKITVSGKIGIPDDANRNGADCFLGTFGYAVGSGNMRTYVNCHNHGDIELAPEAEIAGAIRIGGMFANWETDGAKITLDGCSNTGDITISCKNSLGEGSNFIIAGCVANNSKKTELTVLNGLVNSGNITVDGENTKSYISIGGMFGTTNANNITSFSGYMVNTGNITFSGKSATYLRIGGIVASQSASYDVPMINTGNINCTGTWTTTHTSGARIGGIFGTVSKPHSKVQYYGNIYAISTTPYTGIGVITGSDYAESLVMTDSAIGGKITATTKEVEDGNGDKDTVPMTVTLSETSNIDDDQATEWNDYWYKYIYGSGNAESLATTNNVTLLTSAPSTEQPAPEETPEA